MKSVERSTRKIIQATRIHTKFLRRHANLRFNLHDRKDANHATDYNLVY